MIRILGCASPYAESLVCGASKAVILGFIELCTQGLLKIKVPERLWDAEPDLCLVLQDHF